MKVRVLLLFVALVGIMALAGAPAHAVTPPVRSLGISPLRSELTIAPGTSFDGTVTLTNPGKNPLDVTLNTEAFSVTDEDYDYSFDPSGAGTDWVSFSNSSVTIQPGTVITVGYKVAVPISAEPGGRYLSLFASTSPVANADGVTSVNRVASLLYITIAGDLTKLGKVLTFDSPILTGGDATWTATLQDSGTIHFHSIYNVTVRPIFGSTFASAEGDSLILPSTVRLITQQIPHLDWIGLYRLDYTIGLGDVPAQQETRWILNVPPLQGLILLIIIAIVVLVRLKPKNRLQYEQKA